MRNPERNFEDLKMALVEQVYESGYTNEYAADILFKIYCELDNLEQAHNDAE